eukprot:2229411-Amphidinium_carterae.1
MHAGDSSLSTASWQENLPSSESEGICSDGCHKRGFVGVVEETRRGTQPVPPAPGETHDLTKGKGCGQRAGSASQPNPCTRTL